MDHHAPGKAGVMVGSDLRNLLQPKNFCDSCLFSFSFLDQIIIICSLVENTDPTKIPARIGSVLKETGGEIESISPVSSEQHLRGISCAFPTSWPGLGLGLKSMDTSGLLLWCASCAAPPPPKLLHLQRVLRVDFAEGHEKRFILEYFHLPLQLITRTQGKGVQFMKTSSRECACRNLTNGTATQRDGLE